MSSSSGFPLSGQRPQLISRFEVPQANQVAKVGQAAEPERTVGTAVQGVSTQVAQKIFEAQRLNFPSESPIGRFRGDVTGRGVNEVSGGQGISRLPKQVRPFNPSDPSGVISSLNPAERAAIGAAPGLERPDVSALRPGAEPEGERFIEAEAEEGRFPGVEENRFPDGPAEEVKDAEDTAIERAEHAMLPTPAYALQTAFLSS